MQAVSKSCLVRAIGASALAMGLALALVSPPAHAQKAMNAKIVGGAPMYPSRNIIENAVNSKDHTTLVAAVKAAGLVDTLSGNGPFTVFAPVNKAFDKLPKGTVPALLRPENKSKLAGVLTYHVVSGRLTDADLMAKVDAGGGMTMLRTVNGGTLTVTRAGKSGLIVADTKGNRSRITIANVMQSNGVIHVVDTVMLPG